MTTGDINKIEKMISQARLAGYQTNYAKKFTANCLTLYKRNIDLSELLYPLLHIIEVGFRNALFNAIAQHFKDPNWLLSEQFLAPNEIHVVQKQARYLDKIGKLDPDHLVAELSFGFWCGLLDRRYEHNQVLWPTLLRVVFPYLKVRKIHLIRKRFNRIRRLRNRVSHYEPIWHWQDLPQQHAEIIEAIGWLEPELLKLIDIERFGQLFHQTLNK